MTSAIYQPEGTDPSLPHHRPLARLLLSASLAGLAVLLITGERSVRQAESSVVGWIAAGLLRLATVHSRFLPVVFVTMPAPPHYGTPYWVGMEVTPECTSAWLLAPLLGLAAVLAFGRRLTLRAVIIATAVTAGFLFAVNILRLTLILLAIHWWGYDGYKWSHEVYGSLVTIIGTCVGLGLFVLLVVRLSRRQLAPATD